MPFRTCQRLPIVRTAILACAAMFSLSVAAQPVPPQAYLLKLGSPDSYRLSAREGYTPAEPQKERETARPARLAGLPFAVQIESAAKSAALDPALVHALIFVESRHNPTARSPKGALGLMQVLPATASRYGITNAIRSVDENLRAGTRYLQDLMNLFDGRIELVLAAYNAGENAVFRHGQRIPPYRETQQYVPAVLEKYREWREEPPVEPQIPRRTIYMPGNQLELSIQSRH